MTLMTTLFTNARLIDPEAGTDSIGAVLVQNGRIAAVDKNGTGSDQLFRTRNIGGVCLSFLPG